MAPGCPKILGKIVDVKNGSVFLGSVCSKFDDTGGSNSSDFNCISPGNLTHGETAASDNVSGLTCVGNVYEMNW